MNEELIKRIFFYNKIVIIGYPYSGKTTLYWKLLDQPEAKDYYTLRTDSLIFSPYASGVKVPFKEQLYILIRLLPSGEKYIMEGIQGYRFLRKLAQPDFHTTKDISPDLIIICKTDRTPEYKHLGMRKWADTIWNDYLELERYKPKIIIYEN